jgi:hypothetical protein
MLFVTRITLFKYRLQLPGFELPPAVQASQLEFDGRLAAILERMADRMEEKSPIKDHDLKDAFEPLEIGVRKSRTEDPHQYIAIELKTFLALSQTAESLVMSLANEVYRYSLSFYRAG